MWFVLFATLSFERILNVNDFIFDAVLTISLIMSYKSLKLPSKISTSLEFVGKHSMNIFMFHTFIYYYWFSEFVYSSRNPLFIYLLLLSICLFVSVAIEWIKKNVKFDKLIMKIDTIYGIRQ